MPISRERMRLYPGGSIRSAAWLAIRGRIITRAGDACEGTPKFPECRAANREAHPETGSKVVLTIAHMDQDVANNEDGNLRALCQRCHLSWDHEQHQRNARQTRFRKIGQSDLSPDPLPKPPPSRYVASPHLRRRVEP